MTQTRIERPRRRDRRADAEILPLDARDPDIVRAKAVGRAAPAAPSPAAPRRPAASRPRPPGHHGPFGLVLLRRSRRPGSTGPHGRRQFYRLDQPGRLVAGRPLRTRRIPVPGRQHLVPLAPRPGRLQVIGWAAGRSSTAMVSRRRAPPGSANSWPPGCRQVGPAQAGRGRPCHLCAAGHPGQRKPPAMPFAVGEVGHALVLAGEPAPVRQNPVWISSAMDRSSPGKRGQPRRNPSGGTTNPPSTWIGSNRSPRPRCRRRPGRDQDS